MSDELVIEFKDGSRDWFDPIEKWDSVKEDNESLTINHRGHDYKFPLEDIDRWIIRPYSEWTTYDFIDSENPTQPKESK